MTVAYEVARSSRVPHRDAAFCMGWHRGLVGSAIWCKLTTAGSHSLVGRRPAEPDPKPRDAAFEHFAEMKPHYVAPAPAKAGRHLTNGTYPVDRIGIHTNVLHDSPANDLERVLFLGSSCIYPRSAAQSTREDSLSTGHLEPTNDFSAITNTAGILDLQAARRQQGLPRRSAMPTNLHGDSRRFTPKESHVLTARIRRYARAAESTTVVTNWATVAPRLEFVHSDPTAGSCLHLLEHCGGPTRVNVGAGLDVALPEITEIIAHITEYALDIELAMLSPTAPRRSCSMHRIVRPRLERKRES